MIWTVYLIDDEAHALVVLADYISRTPGLSIVGTATNPLDGLHEISTGQPPDLVFADIDMPVISGLELADLLPASSQVVFTTSFPQYAVEAFEKAAADYLLKPFSYERFLKCIQKVRSAPTQQSSQMPEHTFYLKNGKGNLYKIRPSRIIYLEAALNYVNIYMEEEKLTVYLTLKELEETLPDDMFLRVHKSFIINHHHIISVAPGKLQMSNQEQIPVGRLYQAALSAKLKTLMLTGRRSNA